VIEDQGQVPQSCQDQYHHHHHHQEGSAASSGNQTAGERWDFVGALGKVARMFFSARKGNPG